MPLLRKVAGRLWNLLPLPFERMEVDTSHGAGGKCAGGPPPLNKICDRRDWEDPEWRRGFEDLGYVYDPVRLHRKEWEFTQGLYGLRKLRRLCPDAVALGLGCGHEPILYYFANRLRKVVATDLYEGDFSGREADPYVLAAPEHFAPFAYRRERLEVRRMDATEIVFPDRSFDIVFSFSSLELFGSRKKQARALSEIRRVLRPGGIALITTEIILNSFGYHGEYFRRKELLEGLIPASGLSLAGGDFCFFTSRETFDGLVQVPREIDRLPHLVLRRWKTYFTSCALFLERPVPPGMPEEGRSPRGEEVAVRLPPLLQARLEILRAPKTSAPDRPFTITCRVANSGHSPWARVSPGEVGMVRLGAHLRDTEGRMLIRDYGRADLSRDMAPGDEDDLTIILRAPPGPGRYAVDLDLVREGITWFSPGGTQPPASCELIVAEEIQS